MKSDYKRLGNYIQQVDNRAKDSSNRYELSDIAGISSITKEFNKTKANLVDVTVDSYKICPPNYFAYNPNTARMGDKIPIALNKSNKDVLVSSIYPVFKVDDKVIIPEYLLLYFKRPEFDRYARYMSTGSAREIFDWEEMCRVELPVPSITEQQKIVNNYNAITRRIDILQKINEKLEKTAQAIYRKMFIEDADEKWERCKLGDKIEIKRGASPRPISDYIFSKGYRWLKISDATASKSPYIFSTEEYISEDGLKKTVFLNSGQLVLSNSATPGLPKILKVDTCIHDGWLYFPQTYFSNEYLYLLFLSIREELKAMGNGSIFTNLKTDILKEYEIIVPDEKKLKDFQRKIKPIFEQLLDISKEIKKFKVLQQLIISRISSI